MPLDETGTRDRLSHLLDIFRAAVIGGVQDYYDKYQDVANVHRPTTVRSIIRDHIVDRLRAAIHGKIDVRTQDKNQTTYFNCCGVFRILIKKSDEDGLVELAKTQASLDFQSNEGQLVLNPDVIPDITNLYLSYVPNPDDPREPSVFLICPCDEGWLWRFEIEPPAVKIVPIETPPGTPPEGESDNDLVRLPSEQKPEAE